MRCYWFHTDRQTNSSMHSAAEKCTIQADRTPRYANILLGTEKNNVRTYTQKKSTLEKRRITTKRRIQHTQITRRGKAALSLSRFLVSFCAFRHNHNPLPFDCQHPSDHKRPREEEAGGKESRHDRQRHQHHDRLRERHQRGLHDRYRQVKR